MRGLLDNRFVRVLWRTLSILVVFALVLLASSLFQTLALPALALVLAALAYERLQTDAAIRRLAEQLAGDMQTTKLEVREGRWAELQHAVNRMLQQRLAHQHLQAFLPVWPAAAADLVATTIPPEGVPRQVVILALRLAAPPVEALQKLSTIVAQQAEASPALLEWTGNELLMVFGAFDEQPRGDLLRLAWAAARQICATAALPELTLAMAAGQVKAVLLPGLGYVVVGSTVNQAKTLCDKALLLPYGSVLLCSEELYLLLRHLGGPHASPIDLVVPQVGTPVYAIGM